jgi:hypothetical protein
MQGLNLPRGEMNPSRHLVPRIEGDMRRPWLESFLFRNRLEDRIKLLRHDCVA